MYLVLCLDAENLLVEDIIGNWQDKFFLLCRCGVADS